MRRLALAVLAVLAVLAALAAVAPIALAGPEGDLAAARAVFDRNLDAIRRRDKAAYLACYRSAPTLARSGPEGTETGYEPFLKQAGEKWPDTIVADDLRLVPVAPGVVYGSYRYRVRYGAEEHAGLSERLFVKTPEGWRIAATSAFEAPPGTPPPPRALVGATLLDGNGGPPVKDAVVVLRDGKIDCAGPRAQCPLPEGIAVDDLRGAFVTPGLVDAHVHFSQTGWCDGRPDALDDRARHPYEEVEARLKRDPERFLRSYACSGVTSVFDVGGYPWTLQLPERAARFAPGPRVRAAGPLLSTLDFWLNLPGERQFIHLKDPESARAGVRWLAANGASAVKVWFIVTKELPIAAATPAVMAAGEEARRASLPLIVHATGLAEAKVALAAGAKLLVHGVGDLPVDDEFLALARQAGATYCPTLTVFDGYLALRRASEGTPPALDDPNGCVDLGTRALVAEKLPSPKAGARPTAFFEKRVADERTTGFSNLKRVVEAGIPVAMGTDAGNPLTLHGPSVYAELEAMQAAGMTPMQVLVAATKGGAAAMGAGAGTGTVARGMSADLLVLEADPAADARAFRKLRAVVRGGVLRTQAELRAAVAAAGPSGRLEHP